MSLLPFLLACGLAETPAPPGAPRGAGLGSEPVPTVEAGVVACNDGRPDPRGGGVSGCRLQGSYDLADADVIFHGEDARAWCGTGLVGGADLDDDGADDIGVGCSGEAVGGVVHLFRGHPERVSAPYGEGERVEVGVEHADHARLFGLDARGNFGFVLAAGDVDADGADDLVVGAPYAGAEAEGSVWVAFGPMAAGVQVPAVEWWGVRPRGSFGKNLLVRAAPGSAAEVAVAEYGVHDAGRIRLLPGGAASGAAVALATRTLRGRCDDPAAPRCPPAVALGSETGRGLAVGDLDGDGVQELVVGAPYDDAGGADAGAVYVHRSGGSTALAEDRVLVGLPGDELGRAVAVEDVDGDGWDDLLIGAPGANDHAGAVYLFRGPLSAVHASPATEVLHPEEGARFGSSLAWVGDVDLDGVGDLLVGAPGEDRDEMALDAGAAWLLYGPLGADALAGGARFVGVPGSNTGWAVAPGGDVNEDGHADLLVGAPSADRTDDEPRGAAYLVYGRGA